MPRYEWLQEDRRDERLGLADVIDVLHSRADFDGARAGEIRVGELRLPSDEIVGLVCALIECPAHGTIFIVSLPASAQFRAKRRDGSKVETFDIFQLDRATFDSSGSVELANGARLRAVEVIPALRPYQETKLDWRIVHHTIAYLQAEEECYRCPIEFVSPFLDCSTLPGLRLRRKTPLLKQIKDHIEKREPGLNGVSEQKIADALRKFGIRIPVARPRRPRAMPTS